ncbi:unnamed protein product [Arabis nemorensis]|uniref:TF-B3 domain-containing protein n=1 Tax=Arabis nemorensis TaxID=586526 RepID=A0A565CB22_9BRAS|nr:unnamed protein product [Arabis nemorensis]
MADQVLQSPTNPHFFQPLLLGFTSHLNIPVNFFSKYVQEKNKDKTAKLRSDVSDKTWEVKIDDGRRLTGSWKEFVVAHDLRIGDVIVFRHEGDLVFHVTALGPSCCEIEYTSSQNIDYDSDEHKDNNIDKFYCLLFILNVLKFWRKKTNLMFPSIVLASEIRPMKKIAKKNPRREEDSSLSDHSCFVANVSVSVSNLRDDKLYVPSSFVRSNGLSKTYRRGWRRFCNANGINRGRYMFKLVRNLGTPVIRLCQAEYRHETDKHSYSVRSLAPSSLRDDALYLPREFVRSNGLKEECCEIVLKNENGET